MKTYILTQRLRKVSNWKPSIWKLWIWKLLILGIGGGCCLTCGVRAHAQGSARSGNFGAKSVRKTPLPPLTHPTAQPQTPLPRPAVHAHEARIRAERRRTPQAFPPTGEKMPSGKEVATQDTAEKQRGLLFAKLVRGNPNRPEIALTFDDGPHADFTPRLLDLLKQLNVRATFFMVGKKVVEAPYLVMRMIREGHDIANHTYHHVNLTKISPELVENEIRLDNDVIRQACGLQPRFFRPPGGQYDDETIRAATRLEMITVLWTDDPGDYASPGEEVIETRLLSHIRNGAVLLLHDGIDQTLAILPDLIARLRHAGYHFVTLSEMMQHLETSRFVHS